MSGDRLAPQRLRAVSALKETENTMARWLRFFTILTGCCLLALPSMVSAQGNSKAEWDKTLELAKKEGKVVVSIPASAELRKLIEDAFKKRYPTIETELVPARGSAIIS